jgi:F-type H+-transporting ATPase subunit gamma
MADLVAMRQRIKAVETIKKITHAMRLISMSSHSRLRNKKETLEAYEEAISRLYKSINVSKAVINNAYEEEKEQKDRAFLVLIGSEKNLCGNFNSNLFSYFLLHKPLKILKECSIITVGKNPQLFLKQQKITPFASFDRFSTENFIEIANQIAALVKAEKHCSFIYNYPKSFFAQEPRLLELFETNKNEKLNNSAKYLKEYLWEQPQEEIISQLEEFSIKTKIQTILFNSLLAEYSARFVAMDNSTRNAEKLLQQMKLDYNKMRQAQITKELITTGYDS